MSVHDIFDFENVETDHEPAYVVSLREQNYEGAIPLIRRAVAQDDRRAMGFLAALMTLGKGIEQDTEEAAAWVRQGAVRGDIFSQLAFGVCLACGRGVKANDMEASYWLFQAGRSGHPVAISVLSDVVGRNPGVLGVHFSAEEYHDLVMQMKKPDVLH